ncbi:MAG: D-alanyl-D-alanine carboxypeptidase/D-alanyl-D-alanine-endopeptidase [Phycisphaerales bacterium]|nr:D-alanyl-D-alanine carboxypeptidase/D-alanyl-D-alanine-endopeptidase [Phycisphaerales bacterium]
MQRPTQSQASPRFLLAAALTFLTLVAPVLAGDLDGVIERIIGHTNLQGGSAAVYISDLDTGKEIAAYNADTPMIPASNMKILTTGAASMILGDQFVFRTEIMIDRSMTPPTLIIKGSGDPALGDPDLFNDDQNGLSLASLFDQVADALKAKGITKLGEVVADDRIFDRAYTHPNWPIDQLNRWYCAEVGGINIHTNIINVYPIPGSPGSAPRAVLSPEAPWFDFQINAKTVTKGQDTAWIARPRPANVFTLRGNVRYKTEKDVAIHNPPMFAAALFANALSERGIIIADEETLPETHARLVGEAEMSANSKTIAVITTPLVDILRRTNTNSHNLYAEALLKRLGHELTSDPGSWANGSSVLRMMISEKIGALAAQSTIIDDGSGMSRVNRVTPKTLVQWMGAVALTDAWEMFEDSLATPGTGTLTKRFRSTELSSELHAKSGYLNNTYTLTGVLIHPKSKQRVAFSILLNDIPSGAASRNAKPLHEEIVDAVDDWLDTKAGVSSFGG